MSTDVTPTNTLVSLILRLTLAAVFIYHGLTKIFPTDKNDWGTRWANNMWDKPYRLPSDVIAKLDQLKEVKGKLKDKKAAEEWQKNITELGDELRSLYALDHAKIKVPPAITTTSAQFAVAWGELVGGIALLLGLLTRLAAVGLLVIQAGAIYTMTVTWERGFSILEGGGGAEYNFVLVGAVLAILIAGGGRLSVDSCLFGKKDKAKTPQQTQAPAAV